MGKKIEDMTTAEIQAILDLRHEADAVAKLEALAAEAKVRVAEGKPLGLLYDRVARAAYGR